MCPGNISLRSAAKHPRAVKSTQGCFYLVSLVVLRYGHIRVLVGEVGGQGLHVLVHGLGHVLAVGDGLDDGARTLDGIAAGKDAGMLVRPTSSVSNSPRGVVFRFFVLSVIVVQGPWLMDTMTLSAG